MYREIVSTSCINTRKKKKKSFDKLFTYHSELKQFRKRKIQCFTAGFKPLYVGKNIFQINLSYKGSQSNKIHHAIQKNTRKQLKQK